MCESRAANIASGNRHFGSQLVDVIEASFVTGTDQVLPAPEGEDRAIEFLGLTIEDESKLVICAEHLDPDTSCFRGYLEWAHEARVPFDFTTPDGLNTLFVLAREAGSACAMYVKRGAHPKVQAVH